MRNKRLNQEGVTLVEVLISLVILLIVFLGLIQASILSINHNLRNEVRDEAARIVSEYMAAAIATQVNSIAGVPPPASAVTAVPCPAPPPQPSTLIPPVIPPGVFVPSSPPFPPSTVDRTFRNVKQRFYIQTWGCYPDTSYSIAQVTITVSYLFPGDAAPSMTTATDNVRRY